MAEAVVDVAETIAAPFENTIGAMLTTVLGTTTPALGMREALVGAAIGGVSGFALKMMLGPKEVKGTRADFGLARIEEMLGVGAQIALSAGAGAAAGGGAVLLGLRAPPAYAAGAGVAAALLPYVVTL